MRGAAALGLALTLAADPAAAQPRPTEQIDNPVSVCIARRSDQYGTVAMGVRINDREDRFDRQVRWASVRSEGGLRLSYWVGTGLEPDDLSDIVLGIETPWRGNPRVRIVLSRSGGFGDRPWDVVFGSGYRRYLSGRAEVRIRLAELRAFAAGTPVHVMVVTRRGRILAMDMLQPATIEAAAAAAAAIRPELEAMAADYRNRCVRRPAQEGLIMGDV